jgi:PAS domain S-box-containing protein
VGAIIDINSEESFRLIVETIPGLIAVMTPKGEVAHVNRQVLDYFGRTLEELKKWGTSDAVDPVDLPRVKVAWQHSVETGSPYEFEHRIRRADGEYRWFQSRGFPLRDANGHIVRWYNLLTDIHARKQAEDRLRQENASLKQAEEKIREQEVELRQMLEFMPQLVRVFGPDHERIYANRVSLDYLGVSLEEWRQIRDMGWFVHPDDEDRMRAFFDRARSISSAFELEVRLRKADGSYRWFLVRYNPVCDNKGQVMRWYVAGTDITERKTAEEELQQLVDFVRHIITVLSPDGKITYANRVAREYTGLTLDEYRSVDVLARVIHPDDIQRMRSVRERGLSANNPFEIEARTVGKDGLCRWFLYRYNPSRDERGQIARWYVTGTDIEDRKQAEDGLRQENVALREEIDKASMFEEIVGTSPALKNVLSRISKVAPRDSTVLITGETGTGKELVARAIHRRSDRASRAFVSVNCAAIPRDLIASELFGHEKGAFTGATQQRLGRFELANGGTIFLDEVGELPAETQIALLRVLQEQEFERVGGTRRICVDVRVIAATNRDLQAAISAGSFRSDLFYRLNVFPIEIPSLRERREDIPLLVEYFIDRYARKAGKNIKRVNKKTLELLHSYPWPGNIRELQNVIERSVILCETETFSIDESWLPKQPSLTPKNQRELPRKLLAQEKDMIEAALKESRGRIFGPTGAAAKLGIPRSTLESKIKSLKIDKNRFRTSSEV